MKLVATVLEATLLFSILVALALPAAAEGPDLENGKNAYTVNCLTCHGEKGDGKGPAGVALQPPPRDFSTGVFVFDVDSDGEKGTDADLTAVIKNGAMAYGGSPVMTPWAHLPDKDIQDVIAYIRSLNAESVITTSQE